MAETRSYFYILGLGEYKPDHGFIDMSVIGKTDDDPAVMQKINAAIDAKSKEWSKGQNDARNGPRYKGYLELIPAMREKLGILDIRKEMYNEAKSQIAQELRRPLGNIQAKGHVITEEIERVAKKCELSVDTVSNFVTVEIRNKSVTGETLEKPKSAVKFKDNDTRMATYGYTDIYSFLGDDSSMTRKNLVTTSQWLDIAKKKRDALPAHNKQDIADKRKICEFCITEVFASDEKKAEYDNYLAWKKMFDVLEDAKEAAAITKILTKEQGRKFIDDLQAAGTTKDKAISYLRGFCNEKGIAWDDEGADSLSTLERCPYCPGMVNKNTEICPHCGGELIVACPKCGSKHYVGSRYCANGECRYDFDNFKRAVVLCERAKIETGLLNLDSAKMILDEAEELCSNVKELTLIKAEWQRMNERYGTIAEAIKLNAEKKFFITAKHDLDALKAIFPQYSNPQLEEKINSAISAAKEKLDAATREQNSTNACKAALEAFECCKDYPGIKEIISKAQPASVASVEVKANTDNRVNIVTWKCAKDELTTYKVIRKAGAVPLSEDDADALWDAVSETYADGDIIPGEVYYYSVASCIGPVSSPYVHCREPVANLFEVQNITVSSNEGTVSAKWQNVPDTAEVEVWRDISGFPDKPGCGIKVSNANVNEMIDRGLDNDVTYYYRVFLKYKRGSDVVCSEGISFTGIPSAPPEAIDYLVVKHLQDNLFEAEWDAANGDAVKFYLTTEPVVKQGQILENEELSKTAIELEINLTGSNTGKFELPDSRMYYIFPVTRKNTAAAIGSVVPVTAQKIVSISKIQLSGTDVYVKFAWPDGIDNVLLLYRGDCYPTHPEDAKARRIRVSKAVYDQKQAICVKSIPQGTYYFSLFAELRAGSIITYSTADYKEFRFGSLSRILYEIKVNKMFGKIKGVSVIFTPPEDGVIPELIVVANNHSLPVFRNQGYIVCDIPGQKVSKPVEITLPTAGFTKSTFLKVFTKDEQEAVNYEISLMKNTSPCLK